MIAIVDCGSTKSDWVFLDSNDEVIALHHAMGYNPNIHNTSFVITDEILLLLNQTIKIYIYQAGLISSEQSNAIKNQLKSLTKAQISINNDILGCARSIFQKNKGIIAMLGTGSMAAIYDGSCIVEQVPSLGYLISDEGSGYDLGKQVIRSYYYNNMPQDIRNLFEQQYNLTRIDFLNQLRTANNQARYLAAFNQFLYSNKETDWANNIINNCFKKFIINQINHLSENTPLPIGFVGSIAYLYANELSVIFTQFNKDLYKIVKSPIDGLIAFHKQNQ